MPYTDFTPESAEAKFSPQTNLGDLFPGLPAAEVPSWLPEIRSAGR